MKKLFIILLLIFCSEIRANPFFIDFPKIKEPSIEDFVLLQEKLHEVDVSAIVEEMYPEDGIAIDSSGEARNLHHKTGFLYRISRGRNQIICDPNKGLLPIKEKIKIGEGGDNCIVTYASYNYPYPILIDTFITSLKETGFNGWLYYRLGGFPNPSGSELAYSAVPYVFKPFTMLEAENLGFDYVMWVDCGSVFLNDPTPLFNWLKKTNNFFMRKKNKKKSRVRPGPEKNIFNETVEAIKRVNGADILEVPYYLSTCVFGLKMSHPKSKKIIEGYYKLVEDGFPFFSCFPEEFVLASLVHLYWKDSHAPPFKIRAGKRHKKDIDSAREKGFFFFNYKTVTGNVEHSR